MRADVFKNERRDAVRYVISIGEGVRSLRRSYFKRRDSRSESRLPIHDYNALLVSTYGLWRWPKNIDSYKSSGPGGETMLEKVYVNSNFDCGRSCCVGLLYYRRCSSYWVRRICVLVCHTFGVAGNVLPSGVSVPRIVFAIIAV